MVRVLQLYVELFTFSEKPFDSRQRVLTVSDRRFFYALQGSLESGGSTASPSSSVSSGAASSAAIC